MSDPTDEELQRQAERCKMLCARILQVTSHVDEREARAALAAALTHLSLHNPNPDRALLESIDAVLGLFRDASNSQYRNTDPQVS